jgi:hypothetical protein
MFLPKLALGASIQFLFDKRFSLRESPLHPFPITVIGSRNTKNTGAWVLDRCSDYSVEDLSESPLV